MDLDKLYSRRAWLRAAAAGAALTLSGRTLSAAGRKPSIQVYKSPTCGCCSKWVDHLKQNGFTVSTHDQFDVDSIKKKHGVSDELASCHTGLVDGYVVEGHVPADLIHRMLKERPKAVGLAVPGMPHGSPGMETGRRDAYDVLLFDRAGRTKVYASR